MVNPYLLMIDVLADHPPGPPGQPGRCRKTAADNRSDGRSREEGFAGQAGVLGVDAAPDEELGRDDEFFGHILADLLQRLTTLPKGAG